jgi:hypothetical protein
MLFILCLDSVDFKRNDKTQYSISIACWTYARIVILVNLSQFGVRSLLATVNILLLLLLLLVLLIDKHLCLSAYFI